MSYDIILRFPDKQVADTFCGQMSDGFGENFCDFQHYELKEGADPSKRESYRKLFENGVRVYFITRIFEP